MKLKIKEIIQVIPALTNVSKTKMMLTKSFEVVKMIDSMEKELEIYQKWEKNLYESLNAKTEKGNIIIENEADKKEYEQKVNEMREKEVEIDVVKLLESDFPADAQIDAISLFSLHKVGLVEVEK